MGATHNVAIPVATHGAMHPGRGHGPLLRGNRYTQMPTAACLTQ